MRLIGVVGLPGSGKSEFSRCAAELGIPVLVMGDVIRRVAAERGLSAEDGVLGEISGELRETHGRGAIARLMLPAISGSEHPVVLIDGSAPTPRSTSSVAPSRDSRSSASRLRSRRGGGRLRRRGRSDDLTDAEALQRRDERELGWGLGTALDEAELTVENEGSLGAYCAEVRAMLVSLAEAA